MAASDTFDRIKQLVGRRDVLVSAHGYDELSADGIFFDEVMAGVFDGRLVEDYPAAFKGPSILVLQFDSKKRPIHAVWGIPKGSGGPAVLVTAYRPDPKMWSADLMERRG